MAKRSLINIGKYVSKIKDFLRLFNKIRSLIDRLTRRVSIEDTILLIITLLFGILLTYFAVNEKNPLLFSMYIISAIILFSMFLSIVDDYKKFWFGLAIVIFLIAGLVAYNLIWEESNRHDEPIFLTGWKYCNIFPKGMEDISPPYEIRDFSERRPILLHHPKKLKNTLMKQEI